MHGVPKHEFMCGKSKSLYASQLSPLTFGTRLIHNLVHIYPIDLVLFALHSWLNYV